MCRMSVGRMSAADADLYYAQLVAHHKTCTQCTDAQDCPEGARLLDQWGRAEVSSPDEWFLPHAERQAVRDL